MAAMVRGSLPMKARKRGQGKVHKVMQEFKHGELKSSSGEKVTNRSQAIAIALSEAGLSRKKRKRNPAPPYGKNGVFSARGRIGIR